MGTAQIGKRAADWLLAALLIGGFVLTSSVLRLRPAPQGRPATAVAASTR